jgi:hypothetical protein
MHAKGINSTVKKGINSNVKKGGIAITDDGDNGSISAAEYLADPNNFDPETGKLTIHPEITQIGECTFRNHQKIKSINIIDRPDPLIIEKFAFFGCNITGELIIPPCVSVINMYTFHGNRNLTSINIIDRPNPLIIGGHAFENCNITGELTIPPCVSIIYAVTFGNNRNLTSINIIDRPSPLIIEFYAFENCNITGELTIPSCVSEISYRAFANNKNLTSINIIDRSNELTIGSDAFALCTQLRGKLDLTYARVLYGAFSDNGPFEYVVLSPQMYASRAARLPNMGIRVIDDDDQRIIEYNSDNWERRKNIAVLGNAINNKYLDNPNIRVQRESKQEAGDEIVYGQKDPIPLAEYNKNREKKITLGTTRFQRNIALFMG